MSTGFYLVDTVSISPGPRTEALGFYLEEASRGKGLHNLKTIALDLWMRHPQEVSSPPGAEPLCHLHIHESFIDLQ